jgi:hypothetical protein
MIASPSIYTKSHRRRCSHYRPENSCRRPNIKPEPRPTLLRQEPHHQRGKSLLSLMHRLFLCVPKQHPHRPVMPPGFQPFSPSPPPTVRSVSSGRLPPNRRLNIDEILPAPNATAPVPTCRYNPLTATVYTAAGRAEANQTFINCCRLAAHHSTRFQLVDILTGGPIPADSNIFVREPCHLFRTEILEPQRLFLCRSRVLWNICSVEPVLTW